MNLDKIQAWLALYQHTGAALTVEAVELEDGSLLYCADLRSGRRTTLHAHRRHLLSGCYPTVVLALDALAAMISTETLSQKD